MDATDEPGNGAAAIPSDRIAYDLKDVARKLSISYRKARDMADKGELETFKIGRIRRVHASVLEEYVRQRRQERRAS